MHALVTHTPLHETHQQGTYFRILKPLSIILDPDILRKNACQMNEENTVRPRKTYHLDTETAWNASVDARLDEHFKTEVVNIVWMMKIPFLATSCALSQLRGSVETCPLSRAIAKYVSLLLLLFRHFDIHAGKFIDPNFPYQATVTASPWQINCTVNLHPFI